MPLKAEIRTITPDDAARKEMSDSLRALPGYVEHEFEDCNVYDIPEATT